ncbi:hypothetical protein TNIN_395541 [Trichonephila inaurata madagascariensis]|uniref:Uncharacterized protein n=1 Tax=Trichonephila inaurata madagascariensis TaxID=2747483 RepID=A0A8X6WWG5_9ARAC|nr:hypothetical protein TNIN_395541 [Trichonephila inaurata madagascariensis]
MAEENISDAKVRALIKATKIKIKILNNGNKENLRKDILLFQMKVKLKDERERRRQDQRLRSANYRDVNLNLFRRLDASQILNDDDDSLGLDNFFAELSNVQAPDPNTENQS